MMDPPVVRVVSKWYKQGSLLLIGQGYQNFPVNHIAAVSQLSNEFRGKFTIIQTKDIIPAATNKGLVDRVIRFLF
jgi:hypothetical protein